MTLKGIDPLLSGGYVLISPGLATWKTAASGLKYGSSKTLECTVSWNGGPYTDCGSATFTGTGDQTRTNSICPTPGQTIRVTAFLDYLGGHYYDDEAVGVTE